MIVAISLVPYSASYVADNGFEALKQFRAGSFSKALLFLPNILRAFFVLVMASSAAAAIGVPEGVALVLREADKLSLVSDKLMLFGFTIVFFGIILQLGYYLANLLQRFLGKSLEKKSQSSS